MTDKRRDVFAEDITIAHMEFDSIGIPRGDSAGTFSIAGRLTLALHAAHNNALEKAAEVADDMHHDRCAERIRALKRTP